MARNPKQFESAFEVYTVVRVMGEGGAGRVFEVRDSSGNPFAVKSLHPHLVTTERKKRFKNEMDFGRKRPSPNIVHVVDTGLAEIDSVKVPFYVMPIFIGTFRDLLGKKIPPDRVLPLFNQILDGVEAAHLLGVIHRDLKPENVLYDSTNDRLLVADFGIAHFEEDMLATPVETEAGVKLGNWGYSAPEQRTKGARVDHRADIYALGLMLNEAYTGHVPQGTGYVTVAATSPSQTYLDDLIAKMIQQQPGARPATLEEVKKELIGRKNGFVALQALDKKKREVVRSAAPEAVQAITITAAEWDGGAVNLTLNRMPEDGWVHRLREAMGRRGYLMNLHPNIYQFQRNMVYVGVEERNAQTAIDQFKNAISDATRSYQEHVSGLALEAERVARKRLEQEVAAAETKARVNKGLKI